MIAGEVDTLKMKQGLTVDEYLTIDASASIVGENNAIDDLEVLRDSAPDNFTGVNPRIVQVYSDPENVYSASVEFNKYMNAESVNALTSVTYANDADEIVDVASMKVWLGRRLHLIFDANYDPATEVQTDPLPYETELTIAIDGNALDLEGIPLSMNEIPLTANFTTRKETGFYTSLGSVIDGISDGIVLRYSAAQDKTGKQAVASLATNLKTINHRVEFSSPALMEGRLGLRLKDPYQVNWNNVANNIIDTADGDREWQSYDSFEIDAQKNVYRQFRDSNAQIDTKWGYILDSLTITPTTVADVDSKIFLETDNTKTYIEIPSHLVNIDGVMFSHQYDSLRDIEVRKNLDTQVQYYWQPSFITDQDTGIEYLYNFGEWRDAEGNVLPAAANTLQTSAQWVDEASGDILADDLQWVGQKWMNVDDNAEIISKPSTSWIEGYFASDIDGDSKIDISGLAAFGGRVDADEATREWLTSWIWQADFVAANFELSTNDERSFSYTDFGGYGLNSPQYSLYHINLTSDENYFNQDWENSVNKDIATNSAWLKHTFEYITDAQDTTQVNFSYVVTDSEGNEVYSITKALFVGVKDASWQYFAGNDQQGGFGLELSIQNNGSISIDNLKVTDLSDLDNAENAGVIFSSEFSNGNEGVFIEVQQ
jgi:hypothetical protein